jgi:hypothetical protein
MKVKETVVANMLKDNLCWKIKEKKPTLFIIQLVYYFMTSRKATL